MSERLYTALTRSFVGEWRHACVVDVLITRYHLCISCVGHPRLTCALVRRVLACRSTLSKIILQLSQPMGMQVIVCLSGGQFHDHYRLCLPITGFLVNFSRL